MAALPVEEVRSRVEADFDRIVNVLNKKIALQSISAKGITADHMKRSAEFVAEELSKVGVNAQVVQSHNPNGTPGAWEVIGSKIVDEDAPTVLLYAHHDVQPVPDASAWNTDPFVGTVIDTRLYGRGSADDGGGIAIHSGALQALGDDLKVNIKVFVEGEEEMGSPSFIPFIEEHKDEFDSDVIIVADSGNWSAEIPSLTTSLRGNTDIDVHVKALHHPVHSGQYGGPILDANTLAAMLIASMYDEHGDLAVPGIASEDPIGGLQRDMDEATVRTDAGIVDSYRLAGTGSLAARLWTKPSVTVIGFDAHPVEGSFNVISPETTFRLSLRTAPNQRPEEARRRLPHSWSSMPRSVPRCGSTSLIMAWAGLWIRMPKPPRMPWKPWKRLLAWLLSTRVKAVRFRSFRNCSVFSRRPKSWLPGRRIRRPTRIARTSPSVCPV